MTRAVIFDLFGTLVPKWPSAEAIANRVAISDLFGADRDAFLEAWQATFEDRETGRHSTLAESLQHICRMLDIAAAPSVFQEAAALRLDLHRKAMQPKVGALETIDRAHSRGWRVGLISNCGPGAPTIWPETPFADRVHAATFSSREGIMKPDPRIYERTTSRLEVDATRCLYIGDGGGGELTAARTQGMRAVLLDEPRDLGSTGRGDESASWNGERIPHIRAAAELIS